MESSRKLKKQLRQYRHALNSANDLLVFSGDVIGRLGEAYGVATDVINAVREKDQSAVDAGLNRLEHENIEIPKLLKAFTERTEAYRQIKESLPPETEMP